MHMKSRAEASEIISLGVVIIEAKGDKGREEKQNKNFELLCSGFLINY